ncbi:hypothetical protein GS579_25825 [Rhodococcus hoagii]|nr:hypothetical protein [Prescottella equi]
MTDTTLAPFLALHVLQAIPASLLNRDDAGSIKKITVDGVPRVRVSSQSWKRAIRIGLRTAAIDGGSFGLRTTRFPKLTAEALAGNHGVDPHRAAAVSAAVFTGLGLKANEKTGNTSVAVFASEELPTRVAAALAEHDADIVFDEKKGVVIPDPVLAAARAALDVDATIDLALFGRMLAEIPAATSTAPSPSPTPSPSTRSRSKLTSSPPSTTRQAKAKRSPPCSTPPTSPPPPSTGTSNSTAANCAPTSRQRPPTPRSSKNLRSPPRPRSSNGPSAHSPHPRSGPPPPTPCRSSCSPTPAPRSTHSPTPSPRPSAETRSLRKPLLACCATPPPPAPSPAAPPPPWRSTPPSPITWT